MMAVVRFPRPDWRDGLQPNASGGLRANLLNAAHALREAPDLAGTVRFDEFSGRTEVVSPLPWSRKVDREWRDGDSRALAEWLQREKIQVGPVLVDDAVALVADENTVHPVRDWLGALAWDGEPRLDHWLNAYLGVSYEGATEDHRRYVSAVGARWMISAVARAMSAPVQVDSALILEGVQGAGKSTAARALAGDAWFTDQMAEIGGKDASQDLRGKWVVELGELSAMRGPDVERVKGFMTRQVDHYRPSYGRRSVDVPRQCVFIGSTNRDDYLQDETGNRRFWPVRVGLIDLPALRRDRGHLWAEAVHRYRTGEAWWLDADLARVADREQAERLQVDPWHPIILEWLGRQVLGEHAAHEILRGALGVRDHDMTLREVNRVARVLRIEGWRRVQVRQSGARSWVYRRPEP